MTAYPGLHELQRRHVGRVTQILTDSFYGDAFFEFLFPSASVRRRALPAVFTVIAELYIARGWAFAPTDAVEGVILVRNSKVGVHAPALSTLLKALPLLLYVPIFQTGRKWRQIGPIQRATAAFADDYQDFIWVSMLAVDPACRGRGVMRRLLQPVLEAADRRQTFCLLETENVGNVPIYEHFGLRAVRSGTIQPPGLPYYFMAYDPLGIVADEALA